MDATSQKRERYKIVRALFEAALAEAADQRREYARAHAGGNPEIEREVVQLLDALEKAGHAGFLDVPALKREPSEANLQAGMQLGPYSVIRRLDAGGMGSVYLVERSDDSFKRVAALKIIRPDCVTDDLLRRFQQERQILADLDHPNIARILDGGTTREGLPYFVMEYVEGSHIDKFCSQTRAFVEDRVRLFIQICNAVDYLHRNGVVHRDLKPSNVLVTAGGTAKLVDFGIAKVMSSGSNATRTAPLLTPGYASPEQLLGESVGTDGDVYSLGVILCELLTGCKPYAVTPSANVEQLIAAVTAGKTVTPSTLAGTNPTHPSAESVTQLRRRLAGDLDNILLMALRREPARRYTTAGDFAADLQRYLDERPVVARKDGIAYRTRKFARRNWLGVVGAVVCAGILGWGVDERMEREKLQQRVRQLEATAHQEVVRAEASQAAIQAEIGAANEARIKTSVNTRDNSQRPDLSHITLKPEMYRQEIDDLRQMGEVFKDSLSEAIRLQPGMTAERSQLVALVANYLDDAAAFAGGNAELRLGLAQAYLWLGDLRGYPDEPNLGDHTGALEMYNRARGLVESQAIDPRAGQLIASLESHANAVRQANTDGSH